jgi:phage baseplate assembly protein W
MSTNIKKKVKNFTDISLSFEPNPITGDLTLLSNERAINQAITNIVMFAPGENPFDHDIGSRVYDYLFESIGPATAGLIRNEIERSIRFNEPRVELIDVRVEEREEQNQFDVNIEYKIVGYEQIFYFATILRPTR